MMVWPCRGDLKPNTGWQCPECFVLNKDAQDDDEFLDRICCGCDCLSVVPITNQDLEPVEAPSCEADASQSEGTDSDSVAAVEKA